jgi:MFS family permease
LGCGFITATVPSYIAELSVPSIRGILTGLFEVAYQIGSLVGFWINYGITHNMDPNDAASWRVPMSVQLIPSGLLLIGFFFLYESPLWLMRNDREAEALKVLHALRRIPVEHQCKLANFQPFESDFLQVVSDAEWSIRLARRSPHDAISTKRRGCYCTSLWFWTKGLPMGVVERTVP